MRANRCGFRVGLANRAWVYGQDECGHETSGTGSLSQRHPEYSLSRQRYLNGERYEAERVLTGLIPDGDGRLDVLFDFSSVGAHHNGSFVLSKEILARAPRLWPQFKLHVMVAEEARRFHELDRIEGVQFVPLEVGRKFAVALRLGQPFLLEQVTRLSRLAAVNVYAMLDPIMFDCLYLNSSNPDDLETLWASVFSHADGVIYISDFVRQLFHHRFRPRQGLAELVAYLSLDVQDYRKSIGPDSQDERHILVIGNQSDHKRVKVTVEALSKAFPDEKIVAIGSRIEGQQNVASFDSGGLSDDQMHEQFSGARFVVYPSAYEGFGLPILESLAYGKPVLARSLPVAHTIREKIACPDNLVLFSSTSDLIGRLRHGFPTWRNSSVDRSVAPGNWNTTTSQIGDFLSEVVRSIDFENVLIPRIGRMHLLGQRAEATGEVTPIFGAPQERVRAIYASWSWRLTYPLRWLGSTYLRMKRH
ncbi:MAG: glycosyltransferase [Bryobacteraceae bacterium]